jgi:lipopolysaccharide assembly outer membrane protein LptD (OstA)
MKYTLFLSLLLPGFCFAQHTSSKGSKTAIRIHFDKMVMHNNRTEDGKNKRTKITTENAELILSETVRRTEDNTIMAYGVTITDAHRVLKANKLAYDCTTKTGKLRGHISLTTDGVEEKLGRSAWITLDQNTFKLE